MGNKRGNPVFVKGKSGYPNGRPKGQNSWEAFCHDPDFFLIRHIRWERFCWEHILTAGNGAEAARRAGYSPKSARFIASRLLRKRIVRAMRNIYVKATSVRAIKDSYAKLSS
jgi:hypothetical protein